MAEITNIRNISSGITADSIDVEMIIRKYYQHLDSNKSDSLDEMEKFLENTDYQNLFTEK